MELIAVAFDGEPLGAAFYHKVDAVAPDTVLGSDAVAPVGQIEVDALFEQTVKGVVPGVAGDLAEVEDRALVRRLE